MNIMKWDIQSVKTMQRIGSQKILNTATTGIVLMIFIKEILK